MISTKLAMRALELQKMTLINLSTMQQNNLTETKVTHPVCHPLIVALATADDVTSYKTCSLVEITQRPHVPKGVLFEHKC